MSSSNQSVSNHQENMNNYYDKLGQIEKICLPDSKLLESLIETDIKKFHPLLSSYEAMHSGDETTDWDNYQYKTD
tara:strand:+ start:1685 stop:1909 length:225 start_codon:yes stop_codon:yes gene_type:complete